MSLFWKNKEEIDLSDDSLLQEQAEQKGGTVEENEAAEALSADETKTQQASEETPETEAMSLDAAQQQLTADLPDAQSKWVSAAQEVSRYWPQMKNDMRGLIAKMTEISARYGDNTLWQKAPAGIMREAAIELYGMPKEEHQAISMAIRQAHFEGMRRGAGSLFDKSGLSPSRVHHQKPVSLSEEARILKEMAEAKKIGIF